MLDLPWNTSIALVFQGRGVGHVANPHSERDLCFGRAGFGERLGLELLIEPVRILKGSVGEGSEEKPPKPRVVFPRIEFILLDR